MLQRILTDDSDEREPETPSISLLELVRNESNSMVVVIADVEETPSPPAELAEDVMIVKDMTVEELMSEFNARSSHHGVHHVSVMEV